MGEINVKFNHIKKSAADFLIFFVMAGLCFVIIYPILFMISCSFRSPADMNDPTVSWIPRHLTLDVIKKAAEAMDIKSALINTMSINMVCAVLQTIVCSFTGYGFARYNFRFKKLMLTILLITIIVPQQIILISQYSQFRYFRIFGIAELNLINTPAAMYIPAMMGSGIRSGIMIIVFMLFFRTLPPELEDAAEIDGCNALMTFLRIIVPNSSVPFAVVFLFSAVFYWNDYYISSAFFNDNRTIALMLVNLDSWLSYLLFGNASAQQSTRDIIVWLEAGCLISISPMLILYIILQKYLYRGIEYAGIQ